MNTTTSRRWPATLAGAVLVAAIATGCSSTADSFRQGFNEGYNSGQSTPAAPTSTAPAASTGTPEPPSKPVTIPEGLEGRNLAIVADQLRDLGLTKVSPKSDDDDSQVVLLESNWTVTGIEPGEGETVGSNDVVVVSATKDN